jgi:hypothetical protein
MTGRRAPRRALVLLAVACFALSGPRPAAGQAPDANLKESFARDAGAAAQVVGRLALVLVEPGGARQVRADRPLRRGEKFRVEVSSNVDGWLYLFQLSGSGETTQLWPRRSTDPAAPAGQRVEARRAYLVPDRGVFVFNPKSASERLYVAINAKGERPVLERRPDTTAAPATRAATAHESGPRVTNYLIKHPFGGAGRGLTYEPAPTDAAPYVYFSSAPGDPATRAMLELELRLAQ